MKTTHHFLLSTVLMAVTVSLSFTLSQASAEQTKPQLMFVQTAEDLKANDKTLRLINVNPLTLYFSDRPVRIAGQVTMSAYMHEWTASAGSDNFKNDPPNATLSVYEPGNNQDVITVVEITNPVMVKT